MLIKVSFLFATFLLCSWLTVGSCQDASQNGSLLTDEAAAMKLMQSLNDVYWQSVETYRQFAGGLLSTETLLRQQFLPYYVRLQQYDWRNFNNSLLQRQFEVILRGGVFPPLNFAFKRATNVLKTMSRQRWACPRNSSSGSKCNLAFVYHIKAIFAKSDDLEEIKYYWQEWRNKLPSSVKQALHYYINYYKQLGTPTRKPSAVWYAEYEDADFIAELEQLMQTIRPFYKEVHAHMRHVLRLKYGDNVIPPSGLIPHHLLEQVTYQVWKKDSVLCNPFDNKLPNMQSEMDGIGLNAFDLVNISAQFFTSIGFGNFTDAFMAKHFVPMEPGKAGPDCKSRIFDFGTVEMQYCPKVSYKKLLQTHGDLARVQYAVSKNALPVGLNGEACPGFGSAIGEAIILSASTPKHLQQRLGLLQSYDYDELLNLNRLYRMAVHTLLTLPTYFVHEKLWVAMIDGHVAPNEYNCHYWSLMEQYMGVGAPAQTDAAAYDMPYKFYEGILDQQSSTKKLVGEFLGYNIYRAICLTTGEFERGNAYKTLDNCDFANNRLAGTLLKDMMASGSSKPWRDVIKPLTFSKLTRLTGTAFLEYFESINNWLSEDNISKNLLAGWLPTQQCKGNATQADPNATAGLGVLKVVSEATFSEP